jgi:hypothetical protein
MPELLNETDLRRKALSALEERLGPVDALRFLALVRREPFDYEAWRAKAFAKQSVAELFQEMETLQGGTN